MHLFNEAHSLVYRVIKKLIKGSPLRRMRVSGRNKSWTTMIGRFWRSRPNGFVVNEKEQVIYVLEFKRVSDAGETYVTETQRGAELQHLIVTQDLKKLFKDTRWTVEQLSFVEGTSRCLQAYVTTYLEV